MYKYLIILFSIINTSNSIAKQESEGVIRGKITDGVTSEAIVGVNIIIESIQKVYTTDEEGNFIIENLSPSRYDIKFSFTGFQSVEKQVLVLTGKETILNIEMVESRTILGEVDVKSNSFIALPDVVSGKSFTIEETNRIPANFFDPVRVATAFPGVVASHDQANNLIVRGNSPNTLVWRLEGINIINPNHLSNAGTLADKPLQTGGGVNILSGQMLGNTDFLNGPMPVEYGDGYSAFGLNFRQGNNEKREYTAQASLIGLDFSTEGPIGDKGASYLVNYRYSTVGILTNVIGLDFGGEKITFQDLAFNIETPIGDKVNAKLFGFGGSSSNYFTSDDTPENWVEDKESKDIFYDENVGMLGASIEGTINNGSIKLTTGLSGSSQLREENDQNDLLEAVYSNQLDKADIIWSNNLVFKHKLRKGYYRVGAFVDYNNRKLRDYEWRLNPAIVQTFEGNLEEVLVRPYTDITHALGDKLTVNAGIAYFKYSSQLSGTLEPRLSFFYDIDKSKSITLGYGRTGSRLALYSDMPVEQAINDQISLVYRQRVGKDWTVTSEFYYQALSNIPTSIDGSYSLFNIIDYPEFDGFASNGEGRNYGFEIFTNKRLSNKYYLLAGGSIYQSEFLLNGDWVDSQFNGNYTVNITSGREVIKDNKTFSINARAMYLGGFRRPEIVESISRNIGTTVFDYSSGFPIQNNDYFRVDFSINWKKNKKNHTRTVGIDIQNVFNIQNDGLSYFDVRSDQILSKPQLGTIPVILYRLDF